MAFCHAVGFGFLLFDAARPAAARLPEPWEQLIARLVAAAGDRSLTSTIRNRPTTEPTRKT